MITNEKYVQPPTEPKKDESAFYKIGVTPDGLTQITFGQNNSVQNCITMNNYAVAHMIKLMAVNISDEYIVTVKPAVPERSPDFY